MGQYDIRQFTEDEVMTSEAAAINAWNDERDRMQKENRYQEESLKEQTRYDTEQENLMFQQKQTTAENEYNQAVQEYQLAYEQIGKHNPAMLEKLQTQFGKEYKIPRRDGTFETRYVVPKSVREFTSGKVKSEKQLDKVLDDWKDYTPSQKTAAWPEIKKINRYFTRDLSDIEASAKKAMSHEDNAKLLDTMGNFLPAGYDTAGADGISKWTKAKDILLKDGEVSDAELKLVAADISANIANRKDAEKFWSEFSSNVMKARGDLKLDSDPTVIRDLQTMQETALSNLDIYYPGVSESTDRGKFRKESERLSQDIYKKSFDELNEEEMTDVTNRAGATLFQGAGFTTPKDEEEKEVPLEEKVKSGLGYKFQTFLDPEGKAGAPVGKSVIDPVTGRRDVAHNIAVKLKKNPFKYAKKGIIATEEWPYFKEVSVKEALLNYKKSKD